MYYSLKDAFSEQFGLNLLNESEDYLTKLENTMQNTTRFVNTGGNSEVSDYIRSLLFLRSCDIAVTRKNLLYDNNNEIENITKSDIEFSILSMPCDCPVNYPCCLDMVNGDLKYVLVFPRDLKLFAEIKTFYEMKQTLDNPNFVNENIYKIGRMSDSYNHFDDKLMMAYKQKVDIWKTSINDVVIPLANIYNNSSVSMTGNA